MLQTPRPQVYAFAHKLLPHEAHRQPERLWGNLTTSSWSEYLAWLWTTAGQGEPQQVPLRGLGVEGILTGEAVVRQEGHELVVLRMPEPMAPTEPHWAVIIRREATSAPLRYFVFEQSSTEPGATYMAEWRADGGRIRYGDSGVNPTSEDVRDMVLLEVLSQEMRPAGDASQAAPSAVPAQPFVCELSTLNNLRIWIGLPLCGIGLVWWWLSRSYPRLIDSGGLTLRNGTRCEWNQLTDIRRVRVVGSLTGAKLDYYIQMSFGQQVVNLTPSDFSNGEQALRYVEALLGTRLQDA